MMRSEDLNHEIEESILDVRAGVVMIKREGSTLYITTLDDQQLLVVRDEIGYTCDGDTFETLHNLLIKKSLGYRKHLQDRFNSL